jgi:hypothetical protein
MIARWLQSATAHAPLSRARAGGTVWRDSGHAGGNRGEEVELTVAGMPAQSGRQGGRVGSRDASPANRQLAVNKVATATDPTIPIQRVGLFDGEAMDHNNDDHEVWMRCFTAAIAAVLGAREAADDSDLEAIVKYCGRIADEALDEERTRRPEPPRSGYQTLKPDAIR